MMNECGICARELDGEKRHSLSFGEYEVFFCPHCGSGFTKITSNGEIERRSSTQRAYSALGRVNTYFGRRTEFTLRYTQSLSLIQAHGTVASALDIGCNIGYWLYFLRQNGIANCAGVEIDESCRKFAPDVFGFAAYESLEKCQGVFDLISLCDVLEHVEDPAKFISKTFRLAGSRAIYFIQVPNHQSDMARWLGKFWPWWAVPDHLWHFTPESLRLLLESAGMDVVEVKTCDTVYDLIEYVWPAPIRFMLRPLRHFHLTSGYIYRRAGRGGLIQVLAKIRRERL